MKLNSLFPDQNSYMKLLITETPVKNSRCVDMEVIFPDDTPARYINAIRRVLIDGEVPAKYLKMSADDVKTGDKRIIPEYIQQRVGLIPVHQSIPIGTKYSLLVINNHPVAIDVYVADLNGPKEYLLYPEQEISTLFNGETLVINNIVAAIAVDKESACMGGGYFAGKDHLDGKMKLTFQSYGTLSPRGMIRRAIDVILKMIATCRERIPEALVTENGEAKWTLQGMTSTIIEPIYWAVSRTYGKDVDITVMDHKDYGNSDIRMNLRGDLVIGDVLTKAMDVIGDFYADLLSSIDYNPAVDSKP